MTINGILGFLGSRPGWRRDETSFYYDLSFNSTFPARYSIDSLGLEPLSLDLETYMHGGRVYIAPCRVVNGCPLHEARGFVTLWNDRSFADTLAEQELRARSMLILGDLGRCLIAGPCSEREIPEDDYITSPHTNVAPWELK